MRHRRIAHYETNPIRSDMDKHIRYSGAAQEDSIEERYSAPIRLLQEMCYGAFAPFVQF